MSKRHDEIIERLDRIERALAALVPQQFVYTPPTTADFTLTCSCPKSTPNSTAPTPNVTCPIHGWHITYTKAGSV